ncbi:MAG: phosphate ABC transporter permease subunit PstC [Thermoplasmata archaeon]
MSETNPFPSPSSRTVRRVSRWGDRTFTFLTGLAAAAIIALLIAYVVALYYGALTSINLFGFRFLTNSAWDDTTNVYGVVPFAAGTLLTSAMALLIAVPLSLAAAVFLTQQAPIWLRRPVGQLIELLAAIPSIIFGLWGLIVLVPIMRYDVDPALSTGLGWTGLFNAPITGLDVLTASVVLAIMIIPTITAISRDTVAAVPISQKEAAISLGATDWEVTRHAVLPYARGGIFAAIVLGLGRALGETMAVTLVIGNYNGVPTSLFSPGQTISTLLANQFFEAVNSTERAALIEAGLILLVITLLVNVVARTILSRFERGRGVGQE